VSYQPCIEKVLHGFCPAAVLEEGYLLVRLS